MKRKKELLFSILFTLCFTQITFAGELFRFRHVDNSKYRIISTVYEDVYIDEQFSHSSEITNKVSVSIKSKNPNRGEIKALFYLTEKVSINKNSFSHINKEYTSSFTRDKFGVYSDDQDAYMPVVRNVPIFPEREINSGDSWVKKAYEIHDFRGEPFFVNNPFKIPILVNYTYLGKEYKDGIELDKIKIYYTLFHNINNPIGVGDFILKRITGKSEQILWWDNKKGLPYSYKERFNLVLELKDNREIEFKGSAKARVILSEEMNQDKIEKDIKKKLKEGGIKDWNVKQTEKGISIELTNINFYPNSTLFLPEEIKKLEKIGVILKSYKKRDLLIVGHTAMAGTKKERKKLSKERALAVAEFIVKNKIREEDQILLEGKGGSEPIANNETIEGMKKNRRVEIIILEN